MRRRPVSCNPAARLAILVSITVASGSVAAAAAAAGDATRPPNFVLVFTDDQGYQDVGCFGSPDIKTPNLDRMAKQGRRFTSFYVAQAVCSASRAALITGCYSNRVGIHGALGPGAKHGINADELTIAEVVKQKGYATAAFGKWHLGHHPKFLPTRHGFDEYFGLPYSNDMWPFHPTARHFPPLPLIEGQKVVNPNVTAEDQTHLTTWYTEHAVKFIEKSKDRPFLLYLAHSMPHVPLFVSEKHQGKSARGLYGDVIMEIDWSVGQILDTLKRLDLDSNTLVMFTSDNGGTGRAVNAPLRGFKGSTLEGGMRVPTIAWWPGKIPAGTETAAVTGMMDILPTFAKLAGGSPPADRKLDGADIWPILAGEPGAESPHDVFYYYRGFNLQAVRSGPWKLHLARNELYNLETDIGEGTNVAAANPDEVKRLRELADRMKDDLGLDGIGPGCRPLGKVDNAQPIIGHDGTFRTDL